MSHNLLTFPALLATHDGRFAQYRGRYYGSMQEAIASMSPAEQHRCAQWVMARAAWQRHHKGRVQERQSDRQRCSMSLDDLRRWLDRQRRGKG